MVSWVDIAPTILDFAGALDHETGKVKKSLVARIEPAPGGGQNSRVTQRGKLHGRTFLPLLAEEDVTGWDEVFASHTFHEIQMYYPMRVVRGRKYKLIWNIAYPLPFPFASDLWAAPTWQAQFRLGLDASFGAKTLGSYIQRPQFELYDIEDDPHEGRNLADAPQLTDVLQSLKGRLRDFQRRTNDPWIVKWRYE